MAKINIKLVGAHSGVTLTKDTISDCAELIEQLVGNEGIRRIEITWDDIKIHPAVPEQTVTTTGEELETETDGEGGEDTRPDNSPQHEEPEHIPGEPEDIPDTPPVIFKEQDRISKTNLTPYIDIDIFSMGYHIQDEGKIVICYGTTKVYSSWDDMFKLPKFIDNKSIEDLNNLKQVAVRHFRKWMSDHSDLLPDGVDPDRDFRPLLNQDTKPGNGGTYENTSGGYTGE